MPAIKKKQPKALAAAADQLLETAISEANQYAVEAEKSVRTACRSALLAGLRLLWVHQHTAGGNGRPGEGFKAALGRVSVPQRTAYRWINAAAHVLALHFGLPEDQQYDLPKPGSRDWAKAEKILNDAAGGMSLYRLQLGAAAKGEAHRLDELISRAEAGDDAADGALEKVERGELTLVQAIRAAAGAAATKGRSRRDPVYLDLDGTNGAPRGLFFKSVVTLANTFACWSEAPEAARRLARDAWRELVSNLPAELR